MVLHYLNIIKDIGKGKRKDLVAYLPKLKEWFKNEVRSSEDVKLEAKKL